MIRKMKWVTYKSFAGFKMGGLEPVQPPRGFNRTNHMRRAFYLTAQLESPLWGSVQNYDGAGMSGGPMHWVAVYPKTMRQGGLFGLLRAIEIGSSPDAQTVIKDLWDRFGKHGWYVATDGNLRSTEDGSLISGKEIRNTLSPVGGIVPAIRGDRNYVRASEWVAAFSRVLAHTGTRDAQIRHSIEYLCTGAKGVELKAYRMFVPGLQYTERLKSDELPEDVELAMAVYHAFSPNAPGKAQSVLKGVIESGSEGFAPRLIRALGTSEYGRWHDTWDNRNRYDRTRIAVNRSKLWSSKLVNQIMPKDF